MADFIAQPPSPAIDSAFANPVSGDGAKPERTAATLPFLGVTLQTKTTRDQALREQISLLSLEPVQKAYLTERWLPELDYLGKRARAAQQWHQRLRVVIVVGGVLITALAGLNLGNDQTQPFLWFGFDKKVNDILPFFIFFLGLIVAVAAALDGAFRWGERWRHFRRQSELLRGEGWAFLQLAGPNYQGFKTHAEGFRTFVARAETAIQEEVGEFVTQLARVTEAEDPLAKQQRSTAPVAAARDGPADAPSVIPHSPPRDR